MFIKVSGKEEQPIFAGDGYAGSSEMMRFYIGGLLKHAPALLAICAPTVNSYRRLVPGFEAPVNLGYSARNRSAACRIPMYSADPKSETCGVPLPGSRLQSLSGVRGDVDGGARWHPEPHRSW